MALDSFEGIALSIDVGHIGGDDEGVLVVFQRGIADLVVFAGLYDAEDRLLLLAIIAALDIQHRHAAVDVLQDLLADLLDLGGDDDDLDFFITGKDRGINGKGHDHDDQNAQQ